MALSTGGVFEVRKTGNDSNAGYFNPIASGAGTAAAVINEVLRPMAERGASVAEMKAAVTNYGGE